MIYNFELTSHNKAVLKLIRRAKLGFKRIMIVVHHSYNKCTTPLHIGWALYTVGPTPCLHIGWAPHTVGPTPCEGVLYICCTLSVQESLPLSKII